MFPSISRVEYFFVYRYPNWMAPWPDFPPGSATNPNRPSRRPTSFNTIGDGKCPGECWGQRTVRGNVRWNVRGMSGYRPAGPEWHKRNMVTLDNRLQIQLYIERKHPLRAAATSDAHPTPLDTVLRQVSAGYFSLARIRIVSVCRCGMKIRPTW